MTKFTCSFAILMTMFFAADASAQRNWDAFAGGLANGLSGQQLYTPPAPQQPRSEIRPGTNPNARVIEIIDYQTGRMITLDRQTGFWFDDRGGSGQINAR